MKNGLHGNGFVDRAPLIFAILFILWAFAGLNRASATEPGMHENQINGGWYGWIGNHNVGKMYGYGPDMNVEFLRRHHVNWYWLSHQWVVPFLVADMADVRSTMIAESQRARIWVELYWWGDHSTWLGFAGEENYPGLHDRLAASGVMPGGDDLTGKDWFDLAEDPQIMRSVKKTIKWQLETIFEHVGPDAIYGVLLSEEEPDHGFYVTGTGSERYHADPAHTKRMLARVHNELYDYVKSLYPDLKVSPGFYPAWVDPGTLKADAIVMDNYPPPDFEEIRFQEWIEAYGDISEQYVLLWGYGNLDRQLEVTRLEKIVGLYLDHGITNIGFFRPKFALRDPIFRMFDTRGVGSYQLYDLEAHRRDVAVLIEQTRGVVAALDGVAPPFVEPNPGDADSREALCTLTDDVYAYRERLLDEAYRKAVAMRGWKDGGRLISLATAERWVPASYVERPVPDARQIADWEMLSKEVRSLPAFYEAVLPEEARLKELASSMADDLSTDPVELIDAAEALRKADFTEAYQHATLARSDLVAQRSEQSWEVAVTFENSYPYVLNCEVFLTAEYADGQSQEVYRGIPFEVDQGPTESHTFFLPHRPIALTLSTKKWSGDVGVRELRVSNSRQVLNPDSGEADHVRDFQAFLDDPTTGFTLSPWASVSSLTLKY